MGSSIFLGCRQYEYTKYDRRMYIYTKYLSYLCIVVGVLWPTLFFPLSTYSWFFESITPVTLISLATYLTTTFSVSGILSLPPTSSFPLVRSDKNKCNINENSGGLSAYRDTS